MKFVLIAAGAVAAAAFAAPALAQQAISDPGRCAQFYPNSNCQNLGADNPYTNGGYWGSGWQSRNAYNAYMEQPPMEQPRLRHHKRVHHS
jgi:hypothetical protein